MTINDLALKDIDSVASLHEKNLVSPSSKIGQVFLRKLYLILLSDPKNHVYLVACKKGAIAGSITATKDLAKTNKLFSKLISFSTLLSILKALIFRKVTLIELIRRFMFERTVLKRYPKPYVSILILFVDKQYQRHGIGRGLTNALLEKLKKMGVKKVYADTLLTNRSAQIFYESLGFVQKEDIIDSLVLEKQL